MFLLITNFYSKYAAQFTALVCAQNFYWQERELCVLPVTGTVWPLGSSPSNEPMGNSTTLGSQRSPNFHNFVQLNTIFATFQK